jgi:hypothetical protein
MTVPAAIAARLAAWNRVAALDPTGDRGFGIRDWLSINASRKSRTFYFDFEE